MLLSDRDLGAEIAAGRLELTRRGAKKTRVLALEAAMSRCFALIEKDYHDQKAFGKLTGLRRCGLPGVAVQVPRERPHYYFRPR